MLFRSVESSANLKYVYDCRRQAAPMPHAATPQLILCANDFFSCFVWCKYGTKIYRDTTHVGSSVFWSLVLHPLTPTPTLLQRNHISQLEKRASANMREEPRQKLCCVVCFPFYCRIRGGLPASSNHCGKSLSLMPFGQLPTISGTLLTISLWFAKI